MYCLTLQHLKGNTNYITIEECSFKFDDSGVGIITNLSQLKNDNELSIKTTTSGLKCISWPRAQCLSLKL